MNCLGPEPQTAALRAFRSGRHRPEVLCRPLWGLGTSCRPFRGHVPGFWSRLTFGHGVLVPFDLRSVPFVHQIGGIIIPSAIKQSQAERKSFEEKVVFSKDSICFLRKLFQNGGWFNFDCFFKSPNSLFDGLDGAGSGPGLIGRSGELCCCWGSK